jgi:glycosyltransferase involved in cell wall biosynthesis
MPAVALLTSLFPPSLGGIQTQTLALGRALAELGAEVHVVTRPAPGRAAHEELDGVLVHRVGIVRGGPAGTLAYVSLAARAALALGPRVDVLHAHQLLSPASAALVASALRGVPLVATAHASGPIGDVASLARQGPVGRARLAALRHGADALVAVSGPIRDELVAAGFPGERVHVIPNGVDTRRHVPVDDGERRRARRALGLPPVPAVVYAGRLAPEKGVDVLVDAWADARRRGCVATLVLVGDGPERPALERRARDHGILGTVRFAGSAPDVAPWLRAADAFALPSRTEGLSVALLEAMATGLPVVATDVGGTAAATAGAALLVPPGDAAALGAALAAVLEEPGPAGALGAAARRRVVDELGILQIARRHLDLYREVAEWRAMAGRSAHAGWERADRLRRLVVPGDHGDLRPRRAP